MLASFRRWIGARPRAFSLLSTPGDFARLQGRLGVFFDIEGGSALSGQLSMVELYRDLGVRWMLIAYNKNNALGGGCQDVDRGLTPFGRQGIKDIGLFLGKNDTRSETVVAHIDYVAQLVGADHVGIGLDYVFDTDELVEYLKANPKLFPPEDGYGDSFGMVAPEQLPEIVSGLFAHGYSLGDVRKIIGGNFKRVAQATWPRRAELQS